MTDTVLTHFPGHTFRRTSDVDAHHTFGRYGWDLVAPDGASRSAGPTSSRSTTRGQLTRIVGFFGDVSPLDN